MFYSSFRKILQIQYINIVYLLTKLFLVTHYIIQFKILRKEYRKICILFYYQTLGLVKDGFFYLVTGKTSVTRICGTDHLYCIKVCGECRVCTIVYGVALRLCDGLRYLEQLFTRIVREVDDIRETGLKSGVCCKELCHLV